MMLLAIVVGAALLLFGRRLFWLFVGGVGFAAGLAVAPDLLPGQAEWISLFLAIACGVVGAVLAIVLQKLALGAAGFFAGAYAFIQVLAGVNRPEWIWAGAIVGGVLGAVLVFFLIDWALIVLSALTGALLVVQGAGLAGSQAVLIGFMLFAAGVLLQRARGRRAPPPPPPRHGRAERP